MASIFTGKSGLATVVCVLALLVNSANAITNNTMAPDTAPTNLTTIGCDDHENYVCEDAPWVYCIDAICEDPVSGYSNCYCWNQANGSSILPGNGVSGATCYANVVSGDDQPYGEAMCNSLKAGQMWSTYGGKYGNTSFVPEFGLAFCDQGGFAYCWGAKCTVDPEDDSRSICKCPYVSNTEGYMAAIDKSQCPQQEGNVCNYIHNGGPRGKTADLVYTSAAAITGKSPIMTCEGGEINLDLVPAAGPVSASPTAVPTTAPTAGAPNGSPSSGASASSTAASLFLTVAFVLALFA